jgi:hypothetical protein
MTINFHESKLVANFQDLLELLKNDNVPHRANPEQQSVEIPTQSGSLEGELLILWDARSSLVQCIHPLPFEVPEDRIPAAESAISRINHALTLPGFGLNHVSRLLYYRLSVPRRDDGTLSAQELQRLFRTTVSTAADFYLPLLGVVLEGKNPEQVMAEATLEKTNSSLKSDTPTQGNNAS